MADIIKFVSQVFGSSNDKNISLLHLTYTVGADVVTVSLPDKAWADIGVMMNMQDIDLKGEYPAIVNKVIKHAQKQYPHWMA